MAQSFGTRVFRGFVVTATAGGFQALLHFVSLVVLARLLEPAAFGLVFPIAATFTIATALLTAGVEQAMVQSSTIDEETDRALVQLLFGGSAVACVLINGAIVLLMADGEISQSQVIAHVLTLLLPAHAARAYAHGWLSHTLDFRRLAVLTTLHSVLFVGIGVLLAVLTGDPLALAVPLVAQWLVYVPFCHRAPGLLFRRPPPRSVFIRLWRFGGPMTGATIAQRINEQTDQIAAGFFAPESAGLYNRASRLANIPGRVSNMMAKQLGLAALSKLRDQPLRLAGAYRRGIVLMSLMSVPATLFMVYHAKTLIEVVLGAQWLGGTGVFLFITLSLHIRIVRRLPAWVIVATNHPWSFFQCETLFLVIKAILCMTIGLRSIELLAVAVLVSQIVEFGALVFLASRYSGVGTGALLQAHTGALLSSMALLATMLGIDTVFGGIEAPPWQWLALHVLACGAVVSSLVLGGRLRWIDDDHAWISDQIQSTARRLLRLEVVR